MFNFDIITSMDLRDLELLDMLSEWDEEDSEDQKAAVKKPVRRFRHRPKGFRPVETMHGLNDIDFTFKFRLNKSAVEELLNEIMPYVRVTSRRNNGVAPMHQLLVTLRFYAVGNFSVSNLLGVSRSTACRIVQEISRAIASLYKKYVVVHTDGALPFYKMAEMPRVLGVIKSFHVRLHSQNNLLGNEFKNAEGEYSLKVQAVCDSDLKLMNVVARWPGAADDETVFQNSVLKDKFERAAYGNRWLVGSSAYVNRAYLLTPVTNPRLESEQRYNEAHLKVLKTIEQTLELWKRRFPVLAQILRLQVHNTQNVIIATAVLHNICRINNFEEIPCEVDLPQDMVCTERHENTELGDIADIRQRSQLIYNFFRELYINEKKKRVKV